MVNKKILENLVRAGALDWTGELRAAMFQRLEQVTASASAAQRDRDTGLQRAATRAIESMAATGARAFGTADSIHSVKLVDDLAKLW